ncbi:MAG TPA: PDZ domain-containing protein [Myxococcales bacterium]
MTARYRVRPACVHEHLFEVECRFELPAATPAAGPVDLWMPAWTPGSYLVREYARHVQDFEAFDAEGAPLRFERLDKATWRIHAQGKAQLHVRYRVYAFDLTVRTNHLEGSHGYFNGAAMFVTGDALRARPCSLELSLPEGWRAHCALPASADGVFQARDFDELIDSPVEMGPLPSLTFTAAGKPHEVAIWGEGNFDPAGLTADLQKICEAEAKLFGGLPLERYLFIVLLTDKGRGGLEHAASCTLLLPRTGFRPKKSYEEFLSLSAHEYFHLWNVKRIKPRALVPFDYQRENYTTLLWAMEGVTSYYDALVLRRAGLFDAPRYLAKLGEVVTIVESQPGRRATSLAEASRLAWIKHYRPDENTPNSGISYYSKGEVVAALLDLTLRKATGGQRSLDDLMRLLFNLYGDGSGVPEDGVEKAASDVAGTDLAAFFDRAIRSTEELDYSPFAAAGLVLRRRPKRNVSDRGGTPVDGGDDGPVRPWLGVDLRAGDRAVVATAFTGSPAAKAGLYADDEILALDGLRVTASTLHERIDERAVGETARLTLFRRDQLLHLDVVLEARPATACWLEKLPDATPEQKALYEAWLGEKF